MWEFISESEKFEVDEWKSFLFFFFVYWIKKINMFVFMIKEKKLKLSSNNFMLIFC